MNNIFNISFKIYRVILIIILPLYFLSTIFVGLGGHNPQTSSGEYLFLSFSVLALLSIIFLNKTDRIGLKKWLRILVSIFVFISILFSFYGLYDFWLLNQDHNFGLGDNIPVAVIFCYILVSTVFLVGLIKDKIKATSVNTR